MPANPFMNPNPMTAVHIRSRAGDIFCGFKNPDPEAYGLICGGINTASCRECVSGFKQSEDSAPLCGKCQSYHLENDDLACAILQDIRYCALPEVQ
jgi:hypothetical protein